MNLKELFTFTKDRQSINAIDTWEVRWYRLNGRHGFGMEYLAPEPVVEVFESKENADEFADTLKAAYRLVQCETGIEYISVVKNEYKGTNK